MEFRSGPLVENRVLLSNMADPMISPTMPDNGYRIHVELHVLHYMRKRGSYYGDFLRNEVIQFFLYISKNIVVTLRVIAN